MGRGLKRCGLKGNHIRVIRRHSQTISIPRERVLDDDLDPGRPCCPAGIGLDLPDSPNATNNVTYAQELTTEVSYLAFDLVFGMEYPYESRLRPDGLASGHRPEFCPYHVSFCQTYGAWGPLSPRHTVYKEQRISDYATVLIQRVNFFLIWSWWVHGP